MNSNLSLNLTDSFYSRGVSYSLENMYFVIDLKWTRANTPRHTHTRNNNDEKAFDLKSTTQNIVHWREKPLART